MIIFISPTIFISYHYVDLDTLDTITNLPITPTDLLAMSISSVKSISSMAISSERGGVLHHALP